MRLRLVAVIVLAALLGAVAWQWHADEADARALTLTAIEPDDVHAIDVELRGLPPQHFERRDGHWHAAQGNTDEGRASELAGLAATPVAEWKPAGDFNLANIGLSRPLAILTVNGTRIEFGDMTALGRQRYARIGGRIALVPAEALPRAPRTASLPTTDVPPL